MQLSRLTLVSVLLCAPVAVAQDVPKPAAQLGKLAPMLGTWEGSGTVRHGPEGPEEEWTSKSSVRSVLGGHFLREDLRIEMESMAQPLLMCNLYGWDNENQRYVTIGVNNLGEGDLNELYWTPDGKIVTVEHSVMMGTPIVERWVTELAGDGVIRLRGSQAQGDGPFFTHVSGEMRRSAKTDSEIDIADAAFMPEMMGAAKKRLQLLDPALGEYSLRGWWMAPGGEKKTFTGSETVRAIFDGTVIEMISSGPMGDTPDAPTFEGNAWLTWDDHAGCYRICYANNMGQISSAECRFADGHIITTAAAMHMGQPTAMRGVIELGENGFTKNAEYVLAGAAPPVQVFEASYEKQ